MASFLRVLIPRSLNIHRLQVPSTGLSRPLNRLQAVIRTKMTTQQRSKTQLQLTEYAAEQKVRFSWVYGVSESGAIAATALPVFVPLMYVIWYVLLTVCSAYAKVLCVGVSLVCCSVGVLWAVLGARGGYSR